MSNQKVHGNVLTIHIFIDILLDRWWNVVCVEVRVKLKEKEPF